MTEFTNLNTELDPYLKQMLNSYRNILERNPESARRTREKFLIEINNTLLEPTLPRSTARRSVQSAWILSLAHLKEAFAPFFGRRVVLRGFVTLIILGVFFFGGAGITAYAASLSLPGDAMYPLKTTLENARVKLTFDSAAQARLYLNYAGRRLSEIQALIEQRRYTDIAQAADEFENDIQKTLGVVESLSQTDPARAAVLNAELAEILQDYAAVLFQMLAIIPDDIQPVIQDAIHASQLVASDDDDGNDDDISTPVSPITTTPTPISSMTPEPTLTLTPTIIPTISAVPGGDAENSNDNTNDDDDDDDDDIDDDGDDETDDD